MNFSNLNGHIITNLRPPGASPVCRYTRSVKHTTAGLAASTCAWRGQNPKNPNLALLFLITFADGTPLSLCIPRHRAETVEYKYTVTTQVNAKVRDDNLMYLFIQFHVGKHVVPCTRGPVSQPNFRNDRLNMIKLSNLRVARTLNLRAWSKTNMCSSPKRATHLGSPVGLLVTHPLPKYMSTAVAQTRRVAAFGSLASISWSGRVPKVKHTQCISK